MKVKVQGTIFQRRNNYEASTMFISFSSLVVILANYYSQIKNLHFNIEILPLNLSPVRTHPVSGGGNDTISVGNDEFELDGAQWSA